MSLAKFSAYEPGTVTTGIDVFVTFVKIRIPAKIMNIKIVITLYLSLETFIY